MDHTPYVENKQRENKPVCIATQEVAEGEITYRLLTQEEIDLAELEEKQEQEAINKEEE